MIVESLDFILKCDDLLLNRLRIHGVKAKRFLKVLKVLKVLTIRVSKSASILFCKTKSTVYLNCAVAINMSKFSLMSRIRALAQESLL